MGDSRVGQSRELIQQYFYGGELADSKLSKPPGPNPN